MGIVVSMKIFRKIVGVSASLLFMSSHAGVVSPTAHSRANCVGFNESITWQLGVCAAEGSSIPDGGVTVLPDKQMSEYSTFKEERAKNKASFKQYCYIKESSPQTQSLLNFNMVSQTQLTKTGATGSPADSLHQGINEIQMAYSFRGVPAYEMS